MSATIDLDDSEAVRALWPLEPAMAFLNHGSFGAAPHRVLAAQDEWRRRLEAQPCRFVAREQPGLIRAAAGAVAAFLGARGDDVVFVENATAGINAVLRSQRLAPGDAVLTTDHAYNAVRNTLRFVLDAAGARLQVAAVGLPVAGEAHILDALDAAWTDATRLVVVDHVASPSALIMPVAAIAERCRARGARLLVDGAHGPGLVDLDLPTLGADWYVGNLHKWLCAPKGAGFLWARAERQADLHPVVISHRLGEGFTAEFDLVGTRDVSAWLAAPAAIAFHRALGGAALRARNRRLAIAGAHRLAGRLATETGAPDPLFAGMATVRLPGAPTRERAEALKAILWREHRIETQIQPFAGALWLRLSIQAYNDLDQVERLGEALLPLGGGAVAGRQASR